MANKSYMKIMLWNANGITKKIQELRGFCLNKNYDLMAITETRLINRIPPRIQGYKIVFKNREAQFPGGGIALYIKDTIQAEEVHVNCRNMEAIGIKIRDLKIKLVYNTPRNTITELDMNELTQGEEKVIILGDFNARHENWNCRTNNTSGLFLHRYTDENNLEICAPDKPTRIAHHPNHTDSTLDIAIARNTVIEMETINDLSSDHLPVEVIVHKKPPLLIPRKFKDYNKANWQLFRKTLKQNIVINRDLDTAEKIEESIKTLTRTINTAAELSVPVTRNSDKKWPQEIQEKIRERNTIRNRFKRTRNREDLENLKHYNELVRTMIFAQQENEWHNRIKKCQSRKENVWKMIKNRKLTNNNQEIPALKTEQTYITAKKEKANLLAKTFQTINTQTRNMSNPRTTERINNKYQNLIEGHYEIEQNQLTNPHEIKKIIAKMRPYKAAGEDEIIPKILKNLENKAIVQLNYIFNSCIRKQYFPESWKNSIIRAIKKPGKDPTKPENYRPIALTSNIGKILERIIYKKLYNFLEDENKLIPEQFGFRRNHSTDLQTARIVEEAMINNNTKKTTALALLDLEKAYDTIWQKALLYKMEKLRVPRYIIKLTASYIENRTIQVKIDDIKSEKKLLIEGLPQGSILSPVLFNAYINDIPKQQNTKIALFADDTAVYTSSTNEAHARINLQRHLTILERYFHKWKLKINADKTQLIILTQKKKQPRDNIRIRMNGQPIEEKNEVKYLGLTLDKKLTFKKQTQETRRKAGLATSLIYPYILPQNPLSTKMKTTLYKTYVRSILLYGAPIWSSAAKSNLARIKTLETKVLRIIHNKQCNEISIPDLYRLANVEPVWDVIKKKTRKLLQIKTQNLEITREMGRINKNNAPFRKKHRLINDAIID